MPAYILRNIPPDIWASFKARSEREQIPMRPLLLKLIEAYGKGEIDITAHPRR